MSDENKNDAGESGSGLSDAFKSEISAAVVADVEASKKAKPAPEPKKDATPPPENKDLPPAKDRADENAEPPADGEASGKKDGDEDPASAIDDALIERAVKSGMSIADAKSFQDAQALTRMCDMLEKKANPEEKKPEGEPKKDVDPLEGIPDLDPETYDEKLVGIVKALKDIVRSQTTKLADLEKSYATSGNQVWFDRQVASLGEAFEKVLGKGDRLNRTSEQRAAISALEEKFEILKAGYKAAGKQVDQDAVFKEAVAVALGDVKVKAEAKVKADQLAARKLQHLQRPSGSHEKAKTDPLSDVADAVDRKFFGKR